MWQVDYIRIFLCGSQFFTLHSSFFILHFSFFILHSSFFILSFMSSYLAIAVFGSGAFFEIEAPEDGILSESFLYL